MTPETFEKWLSEYHIKSMSDIARHLGCDRKTAYQLKWRGGSKRDALALAALLAGLKPYGDTE